MSRTRKKSKKIWIILVGILILLVIFRLFLPRIILHYANKSLAKLEGYYGHISDIDISLYRGAYQIDHIFINKVDSANGKRIPFFDTDLIELSIEWPALLDGSIVGQLEFLNPTLIFTKDKAEPKDVQKDTTNFRALLKDLMPLKVNRFEITNGSIHYQDKSTKPVVDVKLDQLNVIALNLSSVRDTAILPATIRATANVYKGTLVLNVRLDPLADDPTFDLDAELKNTSLPEFNDFFKAYGKIDVNEGTFGLYTEIAAKDRKFKGYVKPVIKNLDVLGPEDREDNILRKAWEAVAGAVGEIFENQKKDQVATKVPLEGNFDDTTIGTWYAVTTVLKNAFIQALYPSLDYQINLASVEAEKPEEKKGFLEKIFFGDKHKNHKDNNQSSDKNKD
ncbi:MAG TPA: DUF748 domain-containing protein [Lentimicrobium sp.]|nr:DUF748 domain-containing protein [Lentimicrobium sp.]